MVHRITIQLVCIESRIVQCLCENNKTNIWEFCECARASKTINRKHFYLCGNVFSLKSSIWFCLGNENRRMNLGPFLDRDSDDDNDDNDDDSDDSDENLEEWLNNSGKN